MTTYFYLKNKYEAIQDFVLNESLITLSKDKILKKYDINKSLQVEGTNFYFYHKYFFESKNIYDNQLNKKDYDLKEDFFFYGYAFKNHILINNSKSVALYNFVESKLIKKINHDSYSGSIDLFLNNKIALVFKTSSIIYAYDFIEEKIHWQHNLEDYFKAPSKILEGRVLVVEDRLVFFAHTEDWSKYATFILDANTGEVLNNPKETIFGGKMYVFDGYLWQKKDKGFAKMNPKTFEITHYDLSKQLPTEKIENITMAYHNGLIAISAKPESDAIRSLILLFDTNTGEIVWRKEILEDETKPINNENRCQIQEIQMNEIMIAVSVAGDNLYLFEKEDENGSSDSSKD